MTLEELADLIRAVSANTNGRVDAMRNESNAALMGIQNDLTDVRGEIRAGREDLTSVHHDVAKLRADMTGVKSSLDLATTVAAMRREIDALRTELAELRHKAS